MGRYIVRADVEDWFGIENVKAYADLDGDADATKIQNRIDAGIAKAEDQIDNRFRGYRYQIPFGTAPEKVKDWASRITGVFLYRARGMRDTDADNRMDEHLDQANEEMKAHLVGMRRLDAPLVDNQPNTPVAL